MDKFELNQQVRVKDCNGTIRAGVIKGLSLNTKEELQITVEYSTPVRNNFSKESIITE